MRNLLLQQCIALSIKNSCSGGSLAMQIHFYFISCMYRWFDYSQMYHSSLQWAGPRYFWKVLWKLANVTKTLTDQQHFTYDFVRGIAGKGEARCFGINFHCSSQRLLCSICHAGGENRTDFALHWLTGTACTFYTSFKFSDIKQCFVN